MKPYRRCGTRPGTHVRVGRQHPARAPSGQYAIASDTRVCVPAAPRGLPTRPAAPAWRLKPRTRTGCRLRSARAPRPRQISAD